MLSLLRKIWANEILLLCNIPRASYSIYMVTHISVCCCCFMISCYTDGSFYQGSNLFSDMLQDEGMHYMSISRSTLCSDLIWLFIYSFIYWCSNLCLDIHIPQYMYILLMCVFGHAMSYMLLTVGFIIMEHVHVNELITVKISFIFIISFVKLWYNCVNTFGVK